MWFDVSAEGEEPSRTRANSVRFGEPGQECLCANIAAWRPGFLACDKSGTSGSRDSGVARGSRPGRQARQPLEHVA
ncbi:hypothetical protein Acsp05_17810 [Actinokineospora sp. NBRC 105648]|nr:hypothetical protein Acsp05_17810 [Actinokineospora sp. NBRC 105648]